MLRKYIMIFDYDEENDRNVNRSELAKINDVSYNIFFNLLLLYIKLFLLYFLMINDLNIEYLFEKILIPHYTFSERILNFFFFNIIMKYFNVIQL